MIFDLNLSLIYSLTKNWKTLFFKYLLTSLAVNRLGNERVYEVEKGSEPFKLIPSLIPFNFEDKISRLLVEIASLLFCFRSSIFLTKKNICLEC